MAECDCWDCIAIWSHPFVMHWFKPLNHNCWLVHVVFEWLMMVFRLVLATRYQACCAAKDLLNVTHM